MNGSGNGANPIRKSRGAAKWAVYEERARLEAGDLDYFEAEYVRSLGGNPAKPSDKLVAALLLRNAEFRLYVADTNQAMSDEDDFREQNELLLVMHAMAPAGNQQAIQDLRAIHAGAMRLKGVRYHPAYAQAKHEFIFREQRKPATFTDEYLAQAERVRAARRDRERSTADQFEKQLGKLAEQPPHVQQVTIADWRRNAKRYRAEGKTPPLV